MEQNMSLLDTKMSGILVNIVGSDIKLTVSICSFT